MNNAWIAIKEDIINKPQKKKVRGVTISVALAPFDLPSWAKSHIDEKDGKLHIEFEYYNGSERCIEKDVDEGLSLKVGKTSGRIYVIKFDADHHMGTDADVIQLKLEIKKAEESILNFSEIHSDVRKQSAEAIKNILSSYTNDLVSPMLCA